MKHLILATAIAALSPLALAQSQPVQNQASPSTTLESKSTRVAPADADATLTRLDTNKDGSIDRTEAGAMKGLNDIFDKADGNKDGKLDKVELSGALGQLK